MADVTKGLAAAVNGDVTTGFSASVSGSSTFTIRKDSTFTVSATASTGTIGASAVTKNAGTGKWESTITLGGLAGYAQRGDTWVVTLNGTEYAYVAGRSGEAINVASVDVEVIDAQAADVLVTQADDGVRVTEPTTHQVIGTGQVTSSAWSTVDIAFSGSGYTWETWSLNLSGTGFSYAPTADGESATTIATALASAIIGSTATTKYSATRTGATLRVSRTDGKGFVGQSTIQNAWWGQIQITGVTQSGNSFVADFGSAVMGETDNHDSTSSAQSLDAGQLGPGGEPGHHEARRPSRTSRSRPRATTRSTTTPSPSTARRPPRPSRRSSTSTTASPSTPRSPGGAASSSCSSRSTARTRR